MKKILLLLLILIVLTESKAQECATLSDEWFNPAPTHYVYNYGAGRLTGVPDPENSTNPTDSKTVFEGFTSPTPGTTPVGGVTIGLGYLSDANDNLRFDVMVYDDNAGRPGTQVGGVTGLSPTSLGVVHNFKDIWIKLPSLPVPTTSRFYIGVVMHPGDASDQLIVLVNSNGQGNGDASNSITTTGFGNEKILNVYSRDIDLKIIPKLGVIEDASFSYSGSSYCSNLSDPTPTITGDAGGTFTSSPSGLSINSSTGKIDLSASTGGTYTVEYTTGGGCPESTTHSVEVVDDEPTITCPGNQTIDFNASCQYTLPDYKSLATASDNCSTPTITQSPAPGAVLSSTQTVTLTADDGNGNTKTCTFDVTPSDNTDPVISCPSNQIINIDGVTSAIVPDYTSLAIVTDNCDTSPTVTQSPLAGSSVEFGTTVITLTAEDASSNDDLCTFDLLVQDITSPVVTITSLVANPTNAAFTATFTFSEDVTGFDVTDITLDNGTAGSFAATSTSVYTAEITPTTDGTVTVDVAANVAEDAAANGNTAATQFSVEADFTAPTITITSLVADPSNGALLVTFTFSEDVTGFDVTDITVGNGTAGSFAATSTSVYTAEITPTTDGTVTVDIAANVAEDVATNGNQAAATFSVLYDGTAPSVVITSTEISSTNSNPFPLTITFSEKVTAFTVDDIVVGNGSVTDFSTSDNIVFTVNIIPATDGNVALDIPAAVAQDLAGNNNIAATPFSIDYDSQVDQIICQDITVQLDANGAATIEVSQIDNGSSDSFGIASRSIDITSFNCSDVGDNNVTLTITDSNGNVATCVAVVTVEDTSAPTVITQDITVALDVNGQASITPADIDNGSTDNCAIASRTLDVSSFDVPTTESNTVTLTITDVNGNSATATAVVTFGKVAQSIVFEPIPDKRVGQDPVALQTTGGESGLPVTFQIVTQPATGVASILNNEIIIEGPGSVVVTVSQAGNDIFQAAEDVAQSFDILSSELFLPTLFTPNNDGTNDRFILRGGGNVDNIEFRIFDRDGNPVFNSRSVTELFQNGWDGTNEGKEQPQGAYVWLIKGAFQDGNPLLVNGKNTGIIRLSR